MSGTTTFGWPLIAENQAQKFQTHNDAIEAIDAIVGALQEQSSADGLLGTLSTAQGATLYRSATEWAALPAGVAGQVLRAGGPAGNPSWVSEPYDIAFTFPGLLINGEIVVFVAPRAFSLPVGAASSYGAANVGATGTTTITLKRNGASFGTVSWAATATAATVSIAALTSFVAGDLLTVECPVTADATLADIGITLAGTRS